MNGAVGNMQCPPAREQTESERCGFCKIDAETITIALIAPRHDRAGMAELCLSMLFVQFGV